MKFTISVLALNNLALTRRCIESVLKGGGDFELIVTDNGSMDGTKEYLEALKGERFTVIRNEKNQGFAPPNVHALSVARGELFVMLNNDAVVPPNWLEFLARPFESYSNAALSGPIGSCSELGPDFHGRPGKLEYLEGSCLCCRVDLMRKHGLFDPALPGKAYGEDSDLSLRMRQLGYSIHQCPFRIEHARAATSSMVPQARAWQASNHAYLREKWGHYMRVRKFDYPIIVSRRGAWGDVLLTTPVIAALAEANPLSEIWIETDCGAVFENNPHVKMAAQMFPRPQDARFIDLNMAYENRAETHIIDAYALKAGVKCGRKTIFNTGEYTPANPFFGDNNLVAIHTGPLSWKCKEWGQAKWGELISRLRDANWRVVLIGNERRGDFPCHHDHRAQRPILDVARTLQTCRNFIGVDSFPMHMATAVGCKGVGIFGVTSPKYILADGGIVGVQGDHPEAGVRHRTVGKTFVDDGGRSIATVSVDMVFESFMRTQVPAEQPAPSF